MHAGESRQCLLLAGGVDVQGLAAAHAGGAGGVGQRLQAGHAQCGRQRRDVIEFTHDKTPFHWVGLTHQHQAGRVRRA
ncbi:hypothetical protein G6F61_014890 [Rhizopus arrhizus]|nr:hypothetical protein G6F61_014890 [Rhizopus arrhizus]